METVDRPYQFNIGAQNQGLGTAPALESFDLAEDVPVAHDPNEVGRELTRYLFFAGDLMTPSDKRHNPAVRSGGEYFGQQYKTLVRSKGLVRKGQITPMEVGFDFKNADEMGGDESGLHAVTTIGHGDTHSVYGVKVYPGDEIKGILQAQMNNQSKGIVEIRTLAGVEYPEFQRSQLQHFIFPDEEGSAISWKKAVAGVVPMPVKISVMESHLQERRRATNDTDLHAIIDVMISSCEQYRVWGMNVLKTASQLVKLPAHQGFVHTYSETCEMLFEQLEARREDMLSTDREFAEMFAKVSSGNAISNDETQQLLQRMTENQELLTRLLAQSGGAVPMVPVVERVPVVADVADGVEATSTSSSPRPVCGAVKDDGSLCGAIPITDGNGRCRHHQGR